ncbi:hypothetical protein PO909_016181 [Leuciscus waleckii]
MRGREGEPVSITCPYAKGYENAYKCFYKGNYKDNVIIIRSDGGESSVIKGRFSLKDNPQTRSFTVTISNLKMEDAGPYICRAGYHHYQQIQLNVIRGA